MYKLSIALLAALLLVFSSMLALASGQDSAAAHIALANDALAARRYNVAWIELEKATRFDESNADVWLALADVCTQINKMAPAIAAMEKAHALRTGDTTITRRLFDCYVRFGQNDKIIATGQEILARNASSKGIAFALGMAYYRSQNPGPALTWMERATGEEPRNADAAYYCGRMQVNMGNYRKALAYYDRALALDSVQPGRAYEFAQVLNTAGMFRESLAWFQKALDLGYQAAGDDLRINMAYTYIDAGQADQGIALLEGLLKQRPQDATLLDGLADACMKAGRPREAVVYLDRLYDADPNNARALYRIGLAYMKMGKEDEGKEYCDRAIAQDPSLGVLKQKKSLM